MSVISTSINELVQAIGLTQSANIEKLRANINFSKRKIAALQRVLVHLKSSEMLVLQRLNRTMKMYDIQKYLSSDRYISENPLPSIKPYDVTGPDPDAKINYARRHLKEGMESLEAELNRIDSEILQTSQKIQKLQAILQADQNSLANLSNNSSSVELDNIAKRQYSELYMLYEVHKTYRDLSTDNTVTPPVRAFSSDNKIINQYNTLKIAFKAYAGRNPFVLSGDLKLDYGDPGSDDNETALNIFLERSRKVLGFNQGGFQGELISTAANQFSKEVEKYSKIMMGNIGDGYTSQNLSKQLDSKRVPDSPLAAITSSVENINSYVGNKFKLLSFSSSAEAAKKFFHNKLVGLYDGMPLCEPDPSNDEDKQKQKDQEAQTKAENEAATRYVDQFKKATDTKDKEEVTTYIQSALDQINLAVKSKTSKDVSASSVLIIVKRVYTATNLYQYRILNLSGTLMDYMLIENTNNSLSSDDYVKYTNEIVKLLDLAGIPYTVQN